MCLANPGYGTGSGYYQAMPRRYSLALTPYITAREIADRLGIRDASVRTQMRAMRNRQKNPVDMRVPADELPDDAPRHATLYHRDDVEEWMKDRARRRATNERTQQ